MTEDELKNRISMALKDPILQQGFEIICKENAVLKKELKIFQRNWQDQKNISFDTNCSLYKAKEIIKKLIDDLMAIDGEEIRELEAVKEAEQFLNSEVEE